MHKPSIRIPFQFSLAYLLNNLSNTGRTKKQLLSFALDGALVALCLWGAYSLRLSRPYDDLADIAWLMLLLPPLTVFVFAGLGVYRWVVRTSSARMFEQLFKGVLVSSLMLPVLFMLLPVRFAPRSVFVIYAALLLISTISYRSLWARWHNGKVQAAGKPVAIYGAGSAGRQLLNLFNLGRDYHPEFFIDDNPALWGTRISGVRVYRPDNATLRALLKKYAVEEVILAMPSVKGQPYADIIARVESLGAQVRTMPSISEIVSGHSALDEIREVNLEDLLGREPVMPDIALLERNITGKVVLVTGAGGSIGSELCRQIVLHRPRHLLLFEQSEPALYQIHQELSASSPAGVRVTPVLGSVLDFNRIKLVFERQRPQTVYHAAAYKHVPMVEDNPFEAIKTNVLGTRRILQACQRNAVESFTLISTDKAVRPTNVMGASKRLAEMLVQTLAANAGDPGRYAIVRFGNVLGSSGSVVPLFTRQIQNGGPVTVTHPDMTRYFMTIPEAASLVMQAGAMAQPGDVEVFLLDMGEPVRILDMAKALIRLHGYVPVLNRQIEQVGAAEMAIPIAFTGMRKGEKLYEELLVDKASARATEHTRIFKSSEKDYDSRQFYVLLEEGVLRSVFSEDKKLLLQSLKRLVPGFTHDETLAVAASADKPQTLSPVGTEIT
ncbi:nucleoside-diphosphate sugar epimerase/dehydratase [Granulosicoccaceae sp. 1_MG-2023]|nr:nucleoside-diphosphate sugar epimerase/dehydratase [Granulosicoccaceae sp. 1_MG-2023]